LCRKPDGVLRWILREPPTADWRTPAPRNTSARPRGRGRMTHSPGRHHSSRKRGWSGPAFVFGIESASGEARKRSVPFSDLQIISPRPGGQYGIMVQAPRRKTAPRAVARALGCRKNADFGWSNQVSGKKLGHETSDGEGIFGTASSEGFAVPMPEKNLAKTTRKGRTEQGSAQTFPRLSEVLRESASHARRRRPCAAQAASASSPQRR